MKNIIKNKSKWIASLLLIIIAVYFYGADKNSVIADESSDPQAFPVAIEEVENQKVQIWFKYSGKAEAVNYAEIRPRVSGAVTEIKFEEGANVKKDAVLFVIDPRPYKAQLDIAKADLEAAKTQVSLTKKEYDRAKGLIEDDAISRKILDERSNAYTLAKALQESANARVTKAQIDLDYAHIKAPFSGKTSRAEITVGNIVEAGSNAPLLTSIISDEGIYIDFEIDEKTYFSQIKHALDTAQDVPVKVSIPNVEKTEIIGKIFNVDNKIDVNSGTIRARALLKDGSDALLPGMFVSVEIAGNSGEEKILVSEKAIGTDQDRKFVWVVNDENKTEYRQVSIGNTVNGKRVILSGLEVGERVVTDGIIKIRPETLVIKKEVSKAPEGEEYSEKQ